MKIFIIMLFAILITGCNADNSEFEISALQNIISENEREITSLHRALDILHERHNEQIAHLNNEIAALRNANIVAPNISIPNRRTEPIAETYEEALEIMNELGIENEIVERLIINGEVFTVIGVTQSGISVGLEGDVYIYDTPDETSNVIRTIPARTEIFVRILGISEEAYQLWYGGREHWVKIMMDDHYVGWVRGEDTRLEIGGPKYYTNRTMWMWDNFSSFFI